ncbi:hypothetical protein AMES_1631 [Amycolatopsis mediterranei S699]|uniref:Secreted protein n=2 Tax=Amycolatopsis mediterranei TaxID=33910 RepID=A0A0H3CZE5_AMYMU|nr:hypothetical protein [Amycolatopsis mediterranei]ADJ43455.1 hypothetical protein AMED_1644 [Amycolatopsis mediterranei U32]AEK40160.1 hypothetical protein RAM_08350 [Amycolatopsis mediterranei S699]AFO75167.1 hypothetical protein AMES_1631 [Amycolatopsis mediterranei S699]AGT82296.1 hypothetical protein B737_1632 [Amycolatopsis mediterranei RB]KDO11639.1 hypothetical protein DV26_06275 [Amycolatopsis mediterranei]
MKILFLTAAGLFALTPAAAAQTTTPPPLPTWLRLSASSGHAGEKVSLTVACEGEASPVTTRALRVTVPLDRNAEGHQPWAFFGESVVAAVAPGTYPVSVRCAGKPLTAHFTVLAAQPRPGQVKVLPHGAPRTGDGSAA